MLLSVINIQGRMSWLYWLNQCLYNMELKWRPKMDTSLAPCHQFPIEVLNYTARHSVDFANDDKYYTNYELVLLNESASQ